MSIRRVVAALLLAAVLAPAARADSLDHPELSRVASIFAMRPVTIRCATVAEDPIIGQAWGYTYLDTAEATLDQRLCDLLEQRPGGRRLTMQAIAVNTLVHEAYHMRLWDLRGSEGAVECRAIRHFAVGARLLGYPETMIRLMQPRAVSGHWLLVHAFPEYGSAFCQVPAPWEDTR